MSGVPTRRAFLAMGVATVAGTAGCLGQVTDRDCPDGQRSVDHPVAGDPDADVTVLSFEDYTCGGCRTFVQEHFPLLEAEYVDPGRVRYEHREFPVTGDEWSWLVPNATLAVLEDAGTDVYWEYAKEVYGLFGNYSADGLAALADDLGASPDAVRSAVEEEPFCAHIAEDQEEGEERGVDRTPTVLVNGDAVENPSAPNVADAIEAEL